MCSETPIVEWMELVSPVGTLRLYGWQQGLLAVVLPGIDPVRIETRIARQVRAHGYRRLVFVPGDRVLHVAMQQLGEYFAGVRRHFDLRCDWFGTPFQRAVWESVRTIPFAATRSYSEVAQALGRPRAVRAVGAAVAANPLPIIVPCHRVIGACGALVGYAGGPERKAWLLAHERRVLDAQSRGSEASLETLERAVHPSGEPLPLDTLRIAEEPDQDDASEEAPDVRPVGHAPGIRGGYPERGEASEELEHEPETDQNDRWEVEEERNEAEQRYRSHEPSWVEDEVGSHDS